MNILPIILVFSLDLLFGDPEWFPHPIRGIGMSIKLLDNTLRGNSSKWFERIKGSIAAIIVISITSILAYLLIFYCQRINIFLGNLVWIYIGFVCISIKDLQQKVNDIKRELEKEDLNKARKNLSRIVGRDTKQLSKKEIISASIESIAENTTDGIIAPLFYLFLGGPVLAISYKAVNTLDSMIGYKNEKHIHFGWFSAKLDDVINYIPARICGILMSISSSFIGKNPIRAFKVIHIDGRKHISPNSGISEAAMAGVLGIKLGGPSFYNGSLIKKPYIGNGNKPINLALLSEAIKISLLTSLLGLVLGVIVLWLI